MVKIKKNSKRTLLQVEGKRKFKLKIIRKLLRMTMKMNFHIFPASPTVIILLRFAEPQKNFYKNCSLSESGWLRLLGKWKQAVVALWVELFFSLEYCKLKLAIPPLWEFHHAKFSIEENWSFLNYHSVLSTSITMSTWNKCKCTEQEHFHMDCNKIVEFDHSSSRDQETSIKIHVRRFVMTL